MSELLQKFQSKVQSATPKNDRYFLLQVERVRAEKDKVRVFGRRLDTGMVVAVDTRKSSSGQSIPEVGGVMRADKAMRSPHNHPSVAHYTAEYFHAYGAQDYCLNGIVRANQMRVSSDRITATCELIDLSAVDRLIRTPEEFDAAILELLKPWTRAANPNPLTHDALGKPFWSPNGALGIQPVVHLRFAGSSEIAQMGTFFGLGAIDQNVGSGHKPNPRLPTDEEIIAQFRRNPNYEVLRSCTEDPDFAQVGFVAIPGLRINVGREALGSRENYLANKPSWTWIFDDVPAVNGNHPEARGWRGGVFHMKRTDHGRHIIVDAAPTAEAKLSLHPPLSPFESELMGITVKDGVTRYNKPVQADTPATSQPAPTESAMTTSQPHKVTRLQEEPRQQQDTRQQEASRQPANFETDDFVYSPEDLAAMEGMNSMGLGEEDFAEIDALLEEAAMKQHKTRFSPRM